MNLLDRLSLSTKTAPPNSLKAVVEKPSQEHSPEEQVSIRDAYNLSDKIDSVFFKQYNDGRPSHPVAYIINNSNEKFNEDEIAEIHRRFWLNGSVPILYVSWSNRIDIFSSMISPPFNEKNKAEHNPCDTIDLTAEISEELSREQREIESQIERYSAYKLANGTFWEDDRNRDILNSDKSAHKMLTDKIIDADGKLKNLSKKNKNETLHRKFLLITLLMKYLEDREVFLQDSEDWFAKYGANSYLNLLNRKEPENIKKMLIDLEEKFNGGIFSLPKEYELTKDVIDNICHIVDAKQGEHGQWYLWKLYDFKYIPIEVLSNIYQHFAQKKQGAIFTPTVLANLLLDQVMPFNDLKGDETVFDPTCGSGIFLVLAFRRLVLKKMMDNDWKKLEPYELIDFFGKTIFGIELDEDSANIACFSLAFAVCDALMPYSIWHNNLKFEKLINKNILVGDFLDKIQSIKNIAPNGFDIVVGNPPFIKFSLAKTREQNISSCLLNKIANRQLEYLILLYICEYGYIKENGYCV